MDRLPYPVLPALPPPAKRPRRRLWPLFLAFVLAALAAGVGAWFFYGLTAPSGMRTTATRPVGAGSP